jgi:hypothetical protein
MKPTNKGYIYMGIQSAKGYYGEPNIAIPFLDDGFSVSQQSNTLRDGQDNDYMIEDIKMEHRETFAFSVYARPDICSYLGHFVLGDYSVTATGDPYTRTMTRGEREWLTVERQLSTTFYQRLVDCKIENMTISGEAGRPVKVTIDGNALTATIRTTGGSENYATDKPFMFYHGTGRFDIDGSTSSYIKGFEVNIKVNSGGGLRDDRFEIVDLPDFGYSVDCSLELYTSSLTRLKKVNYNTSTTPQGDFSTGSIDIDCQYVQTSTRQLKITIPKISWQSISGDNLNPAGATMTESIAGVALKQSTTDLLTLTTMGSLNIDYIVDNNDEYITDNNDQVLIGVK